MESTALKGLRTIHTARENGMNVWMQGRRMHATTVDLWYMYESIHSVNECFKPYAFKSVYARNYKSEVHNRLLGSFGSRPFPNA